VSALAIFEVTETERPVCRLGNRGRPELPSNSIHTGFPIKIRGNTHFPMSDLYNLPMAVRMSKFVTKSWTNPVDRIGGFWASET